MTTRIVAGSAGLLLAGLGAVVMAGWHWESVLLVQLHAGGAPMVVNAALCFSLVGLGLLFGAYRVRSLELALGIVVAIIAFATLTQYLFPIDLGIDRILARPWTWAELTKPGRMTANAAALFGIVGIVLALGTHRTALAWATGAIIALNGALYACAHLPLVAELGGWIGWTKVSLHTALGFVVMGVGFMSYRGAKAPLPHLKQGSKKPLAQDVLGAVLFLLVATAGVNLWQVLVHVEIVRLAQETRLAAQGLAQQLVRTHAQRLAMIERMAARLERNPELLASGAWDRDAQAYIDDVPGILAVAVHDARGFVLPPVTGPSGFAVTPPVDALTRALQTMESVTTPALVIAPFKRPQGPAAVVASIAYTDLMQQLLEGVLPGHGLRMLIGDELVYERTPNSEAPRGTPVVSFTIPGTLIEPGWRGEIWPDSRLIEGHRGPLPLAVLLLSLAAALLVALAARSSQQLRRQVEIDEAIWRESHDVLCTIGPDGRIIRVSGAVRTVWGYEPSELEGELFTVVSVDADGEDPEARLQRRKNVVSAHIDTRRRDGSIVPMSWSSIWSEELNLMIAIGRDVTEQARYEEELERRVAARTHELTLANAELEAFSYSVSHDLRTPLRAIAGFTELLHEDLRDQLDETAQHYFRRVLDGTSRMSQLIDDLLRLGRLSRLDLERVEIDLSALAHAILDRMHAAEPTKPVQIHVQPGLTAHGDPHLLELVLENLFGNAWKFTRDRDPAVIEFTQTAGVFSIKDNGVGFDMQYARSLFGVFQRLHGIDEFPGTGIGLATVKRIVERHGGEVGAHGEIGQGAEFRFTLG